MSRKRRTVCGVEGELPGCPGRYIRARKTGVDRVAIDIPLRAIVSSECAG